MARWTKVSAPALVVGLAASQILTAYEYPLTSTSVREGYFLGSRRDEKTTAFLGRYVKRLPLPKTGPHIAEIEIDTPYARVVERALVAPPGYSSQQAEEEYRNDPNSVRVRVEIHLTPTYPYPLPNPSGGIRLRPDDFWRDFSVGVFQKRELTPRVVAGRPIYSGSDMGGSQLSGAAIELEFAAEEVASKPTRVEVLAPDGQRVVAEFDLDKLK